MFVGSLSQVVRRTLRDTPVPLYTHTSPWPIRGSRFAQFRVFEAFLGADFWEGDVTKHSSVKKMWFSVERGEGFSE